jgi:DNA-directed RNA polymerase specialized sigma24 family protein
MNLERSFTPILYAIGFKILRVHRRKAAFRATFLGKAPAFHEPAARGSTDAALLIRHAVAKLESTDREVLLLREFEQLSYAEIADLLRLPAKTRMSMVQAPRHFFPSSIQ